MEAEEAGGRGQGFADDSGKEASADGSRGSGGGGRQESANSSKEEASAEGF